MSHERLGAAGRGKGRFGRPPSFAAATLLLLVTLFASRLEPSEALRYE